MYYVYKAGDELKARLYINVLFVYIYIYMNVLFIFVHYLYMY